MKVERVNKFLNKALRITTNDRSDICVWLEAAFLALYAWNCCPIDRTDISRALVAIGRELPFPIDHQTIAVSTLSKETQTINRIRSFLEQTKDLVKQNKDLIKLLNEDRRQYHVKLINLHRQQKIFDENDLVLVHRQVQSSTDKNQVAKLKYACYGPFKVEQYLSNGSYILRALNNSNI